MSAKTFTIVAFGDSITAAAEQPPENRWTALLHRALQGRFPEINITLINAGVGGNTTREGIRRLDSDVLRHTPDLVVVEFGNDGTPEEDRHVPYEEFTANLELIRARVAERSKAHAVLMIFPPIIDAWHSAAFPFLKAWRHGGQDAAQEQYRRLMRQFAADCGLPVIPLDLELRNAMAKDGDGEYILPDGVHLTAGGNRLEAEVALEIVAGEVNAVRRERT